MVKAGSISSPMRANEKGGSEGAGREEGIPPKREPIVSTGRPASPTSAEAKTTAARKAGTRGAKRRSPMISTRAAAETPSAAGARLARAAQNVAHCAATPPGSFSIATYNSRLEQADFRGVNQPKSVLIFFVVSLEQ